MGWNFGPLLSAVAGRSEVVKSICLLAFGLVALLLGGVETYTTVMPLASTILRDDGQALSDKATRAWPASHRRAGIFPRLGLPMLVWLFLGFVAWQFLAPGDVPTGPMPTASSSNGPPGCAEKGATAALAGPGFTPLAPTDPLESRRGDKSDSIDTELVRLLL